MSARPPVVTGQALDALVLRLVAEVLVVRPDQVTMDSTLMAELGAESIDFLDLVFQLEEALGRRIPITRWQRYLEQRFGPRDLSDIITPRVVRDFAEIEAQAP